MTSFTEDMRRRGMTPASRTLELRSSPPAPPRPHPARLAVGARGGREAASPGGSRDDGDRDAARPERLVPGLTAKDLEERSFYELLEDRYGIVIVGGTQTIEPTVTNEEESAALGVPLHSPAFLFERVTHAEDGEIVEFVSSLYRGDRYRLVTDLSRNRGSPAGAVARARRWSTVAQTGLDNSTPLCDSPPMSKWYKPSRPSRASPRRGTTSGGCGRGPSSMGVRDHEERIIGVAGARGDRRRVASTATAGRLAAAANTLTVWLMTDAQQNPSWEKIVNAANAAFEKDHAGWNVNVQYKTWGNHLQKFDATLAGGNAPDVIELGNTEMTKYMAAGAFQDLTSVKSSIPNSSTWLEGLAASGNTAASCTASRTTQGRASSPTAPTCSRRPASRSADEPRRVHGGGQEARREEQDRRASRRSTSPAPTGTSRWASSTTTAARSPRR